MPALGYSLFPARRLVRYTVIWASVPGIDRGVLGAGRSEGSRDPTRYDHNGRPRTLTLRGLLWDLVIRRWRAREYPTSGGPALSTYLFHRRRGRPISYSSYRSAFVAVCQRAEVEGRTTHDFRRTVARDLRRAEVSESVRTLECPGLPPLRRHHRSKGAGGRSRCQGTPRPSPLLSPSVPMRRVGAMRIG
jgi:Phage integrase family